jgi:hypothetical protein
MVSVDLIRQCLPPGGYAGQIGGVLRLFDRQQQAFVGLRPT